MYLVKDESIPQRIGKYFFWSSSFSRADRSQALKPSCIGTKKVLGFGVFIFLTYIYHSGYY